MEVLTDMNSVLPPNPNPDGAEDSDSLSLPEEKDSAHDSGSDGDVLMTDAPTAGGPIPLPPPPPVGLSYTFCLALSYTFCPALSLRNFPRFPRTFEHSHIRTF